jgi:hypothetical protein
MRTHTTHNLQHEHHIVSAEGDDSHLVTIVIAREVHSERPPFGPELTLHNGSHRIEMPLSEWRKFRIAVEETIAAWEAEEKTRSPATPTLR